MNASVEHPAADAAPTPHHFDASRPAHALAAVVMLGSVGWSLAAFASPWVAVPIALMLTYCFARLVRIAASHASWLTRLLAGLCACGLFALTFGLSSGALYAMLVAENGAVDDYERHRLQVEPQLRRIAIDARGALNAIGSLKDLADQKILLESSSDPSQSKDTCPRIPGSRGGAGPVTTFWVTEKGLAEALQAQIDGLVQNIEAAVRALPKERAQRFVDVRKNMALLNEAARMAQAVLGGGPVRSAFESLSKNAGGMVVLRGKELACGAPDRQSAHAAAVAALARLKAAAAPAEWAPAVDPSQREAMATRGLLRGFNTALKVMTLGRLGSFADDPRMRRALREHGYVNTETLCMVLAVMAELSVILTAFLAARSGRPAVSFDPVQWLHRRAEMVAGREGRTARLQRAILAPVRALVGMFWSQPPKRPGWAARPAAQGADLNVPISSRELDLAAELHPFLVRVQSTDYVIINEAHARAQVAAQWLDDRSLLDSVARDVAWDLLSEHPRVARLLARTVASPTKTRMDVYRVHPSLARAMRLRFLDGQVRSPGESRPYGTFGAGLGAAGGAHGR